jgi:hypothetical protein
MASRRLENDPKIVEVDSGMSYTPFYIQRAKTAVLELSTDTYTTKSGEFGICRPG